MSVNDLINYFGVVLVGVVTFCLVKLPICLIGVGVRCTTLFFKFLAARLAHPLQAIIKSYE